MAEIIVVPGDLTTQEVDAVVNAANSSLLGGGGVDGAIHRRGGPEILEECRQLRNGRLADGLAPGQAVATGAGRLPARWVIHAVGPVYDQNEDRSAVLALCHTEALRVADELGAATVAFPAISCGAYGYPLDLAAPVALAAVWEAITNVAEVRFVMHDDDSLEAFTSALAALA